jgi:hypothetical protein
MVIPFGAPEVAHLVDQGLESVVHGLWPFPSPSWRILPTSLQVVRLLMKYQALIPIESRLEGGG